LVGAQQLGLRGLALGGVLSVLALCDVAAMYVGGRLSDRVGRLPVLLAALGAGVVGAGLGALALAASSTGWFVVACAFLGTAVGTAWVIPMASVVDLAARPESGLAAYRIVADVGMGAGGVLAGAGVGAWGAGGTLAACAAALVLLAAAAAVLRETRLAGSVPGPGAAAGGPEPAVGAPALPAATARP
jgi:MFS family permease